MAIDELLKTRSGNQCELCSENKNLSVYSIPPSNGNSVDEAVLICSTCISQIKDEAPMDENHWRCLNESMWSEYDAVKILSYRLLKKLNHLDWASDLLNMIYLEEEALKFAKSYGYGRDEEDIVIHKDANGNVLQNGDSVTLIKDLNVKGGNFTAKRGTAVRNISLVHDNAAQIEGKVEGQHIVILTEFVKK